MANLAIDCSIPGLAADAISDFRNGAIAAITVPIRAGAIPVAYHWAGVPGLPAAMATANAVAFIRAEYANQGISSVEAENVRRGVVNLLPVAPGDDAALANSVAWVAGLADARRRAVILGATRAGAVAGWRLADVDILPAETAVDGRRPIHWDAGHNALRTAHGPNAADQTLAEALSRSFAVLTDVEAEVAFLCMQMGVAAVPLSGFTLFARGHHYLTSDNRAQQAVMKQMRQSASAAAWTMLSTNMDDTLDLVWHKSVHPVSTIVLRAMAIAPEVPERLKAARLGSISVRLPYAEPEVLAARAMVRVVEACQAIVLASASEVAVPNLVRALEATEGFVIGAADVAPPMAAFPTVVSRATAIRDMLVPAMARAEAVVAFSIGLYSAMLEDAPGGGRGNTLMEARSLTRLRAGNVASVAMGAQYYAQYRLVVKNMASQGTMAPVNLHD